MEKFKILIVDDEQDFLETILKRLKARKIEVTGVHAHGAYLRMYVSMTGQASVYMPCP